jgi:hypothetical protein
MAMRRTACACTVFGLITAIGGCRQPLGVDLVPVSGHVTLDGRPLTGVAIVFAPDGKAGNKGPASIGWLDVNGRYDVRSVRGYAGAVPGPQRIYFVDPAVNASADDTRPAGLPASLLAPDSSQLTTTVDSSGPNSRDFALSSKGTPP